MATDVQQATPSTPAPERSDAGASRADRPAVVQKWRLDGRVLVWTLAVLAVLTPAGYFWHRTQVRRHAAAILDHARDLFAQKKWRPASSAFHQYLQLRPDDAEARA